MVPDAVVGWEGSESGKALQRRARAPEGGSRQGMRLRARWRWVGLWEGPGLLAENEGGSCSRRSTCWELGDPLLIASPGILQLEPPLSWVPAQRLQSSSAVHSNAVPGGESWLLLLGLRAGKSLLKNSAMKWLCPGGAAGPPPTKKSPRGAFPGAWKWLGVARSHPHQFLPGGPFWAVWRWAGGRTQV